MREPLYFPADVPRLAGWLYWPRAETTSDVGLVVCKPFGYEALCGHRGLRAFAHSAAASGVPTLSFDYSGTGDSLDLDADAEQIEAWCRDIVAAVAELRRRTGVKRVCLLGFRLGALLASLTAGLTTIDALIVVSPIVNGRTYLRELQSMALMAARGAGERRPAAPPPAARGPESMEVNGYHLSAATVCRLRQIDLSALDVPSVAEWLVVDRAGMPVARIWSESLSAAAQKVEYVVLPGFVDMMMVAPQYTRIPEAMIGHVRDWLLRFASPASAATTRLGTPPAASAIALSLPLSAEEATSAVAPIERPVRFGEDSMLFGIVTEPHRNVARGPVVILVNAGADHHVCIGRLYVRLARLWARNGYTVLRMDLAGLGDSATRRGRPDNEVYPPMAVDDIRAAVEFMRERYQASAVTLAGLCSGAYHVLQAAIAAVPVSSILMVNPQTFFWREGMSLEDIQSVEVISAPRLYRERALSLQHWTRLLTGRVDVWRITRVMLHRALMTMASAVRNVLRLLRIRLPDDLGWELERLAARGVRVTMVFARGEAGIELLKLQAGAAIKSLRAHCPIHIIDGGDHTFSQSSARAALIEVLSDALLNRPRPPAPEYSAPLSVDQAL